MGKATVCVAQNNCHPSKVKESRTTGAANWGLARLMRPARARSRCVIREVPLCQCPNVCTGNHCGPLARWKHQNLHVGCDVIISSLSGFVVNADKGEGDFLSPPRQSSRDHQRHSRDGNDDRGKHVDLRIDTKPHARIDTHRQSLCRCTRYELRHDEIVDGKGEGK